MLLRKKATFTAFLLSGSLMIATFFPGLVVMGRVISLELHGQPSESGKDLAISLGLSSLLTGLAFGLAFYVIFHKMVLARLERLAEFIENLHSTRVFSPRLTDVENDEISRLTGLLNRLLETVQENENTIREQQAHLLTHHKLTTIGTLAGGIAHEIGNPLTTVLWNNRALKRWIDSLPAEYQNGNGFYLIEKQKSAIDRIAAIVDDVRAFAAPPHGIPEAISVHKVIHDTLSFLGEALDTSGITLRTSLRSKSPMVLAAASQIQQVVMHLLLNAREAIEHQNKRPGIIEIESRDLENGIELRVADNGCGINPDDLERVFDPFFTTKRADGSAGLGLAVVHSIVTSLRGEIRVESRVGQSTSFCVRIPRNISVPMGLTRAQEQSSEARTATLQGINIYT